MSGEISTIQSLKAVDAWIDVINANISGGVRTAFKSSRLKFSGSNTDVVSAGNSTSLPLQLPEPSLTTANTVIDWTQGAITASTENTHLAIQGDNRYFLVVDPGSVNADGTLKAMTSTSRLYVTRDGEFHTNQNGLLVNTAGYCLITFGGIGGNNGIQWTPTLFGTATPVRAVYNDLDLQVPATVATAAHRLSNFLKIQLLGAYTYADGVTQINGGSPTGVFGEAIPTSPSGRDSLIYSTLGSTVFDPQLDTSTGKFRSAFQIWGTNPADVTILSKSLEASNSSMTQSVPELSLAQKLFSALTKVLQTKQTNVDGVLNLVR